MFFMRCRRRRDLGRSGHERFTYNFLFDGLEIWVNAGLVGSTCMYQIRTFLLYNMTTGWKETAH